MTVFNVIEDRGCDIRYTIISGTYMDCVNWMDRNTIPSPLNNTIRISINAENINGNGDPFTYTIEPDGEDDNVFSFREVLDMYASIYEIRTLCDSIANEDVANHIRTNLDGIYNIIRKHISDDMDAAVSAML